MCELVAERHAQVARLYGVARRDGQRAAATTATTGRGLETLQVQKCHGWFTSCQWRQNPIRLFRSRLSDPATDTVVGARMTAFCCVADQWQSATLRLLGVAELHVATVSVLPPPP
jgi:hypothetical protein